MGPLVSILTDLLIAFLTAVCVKCRIDVKAHSGDIAAVAGTLALGLGTGATALGLWMYAKWQHSKLYQKANGTDATPTPPAAPAILLLLLVSLAFGGCSLFATPTPATPQQLAIQQVTEAEALYILASTPIDIAIANGSIKGQTAKDLQAVEVIAFRYLSAARDAANAGNTVDAATQLQLFEASRNDLVQLFTKTKPTTQPASAQSAPSLE